MQDNGKDFRLNGRNGQNERKITWNLIWNGCADSSSIVSAYKNNWGLQNCCKIYGSMEMSLSLHNALEYNKQIFFLKLSKIFENDCWWKEKTLYCIHLKGCGHWNRHHSKFQIWKKVLKVSFFLASSDTILPKIH